MPSFAHDLRHSNASKASLLSRLRVSFKTCLELENNRSGSADIAGMEKISRAIGASRFVDLAQLSQ